MSLPYELRTWTMCTALTLVTSACTTRTFVVEESDTEMEDGEGGECVSDADCPLDYACIEEVCEYLGAEEGQEGEEPLGCESTSDCDPLELCIANACQAQPSLSACEGGPPSVIPIPVQGVGLALSFADLQGEGSDELVVATETQLELHPSAGELSLHPRGLPSPAVRAMVGGQFGPGPGEAIALLLDGDSLAIHVNDGMGGLEPAQLGVTDLPDASRLLTANFGADEIDELVVYGPGAVVRIGGQLVELSAEPVIDMAYRPASTEYGGVSMLGPEQVSFVDLGAQLQDLVSFAPGEPRAQTSVVTYGEPTDLSAWRVQDWTYLVSILPAASTPEPVAPLGLPLRVATMEGLNFLGDMYPDVGLISEEGELWLLQEINYLPGQCLMQLPLPGLARELAVGDHDGNGDEELAVLLDDGSVVIVDP